MTLLARMLCRWLGRPATGPERRERAAEEAEAGETREVSPDDLTAIRGIGIATENRLYRAGIKSYGQLARSTPQEVRKILGKLGANAKIEEWIAQARELAWQK